MNKPHFPKPFRQEQSPIHNANELFEERMTLGQRAADRVATLVGSWPFIIIQSSLLLLWVVLNVTAIVQRWDPYPFILMNLVLSLQAAFTAPIIMMSQKRQSEKDRIEAHNDFLINSKAEEEVRAILTHLSAQDEALTLMFEQLAELRQLASEALTHNQGNIKP